MRKPENVDSARQRHKYFLRRERSRANDWIINFEASLDSQTASSFSAFYHWAVRRSLRSLSFEEEDIKRVSCTKETHTETELTLWHSPNHFHLLSHSKSGRFASQCVCSLSIVISLVRTGKDVVTINFRDGDAQRYALKVSSVHHCSGLHACLAQETHGSASCSRFQPPIKPAGRKAMSTCMSLAVILTRA